MTQVRLLTADDAAAFKVVRLRSLREHPEAFGSSVGEEENATTEQNAEFLSKSLPNNPMWGAFVDDQLVGLINLSRSPRNKMRHRAHIGAMYVAPEARGQKLARALLDAAIDYARTLDGVEDVVLAVTVSNEAARALYVSAGFQTYSIDPRLIYTDDRYYDVEWMILPLRKTST
jgi:ribosomal protein S18 acetylase RimI-like enzyme